jgi:hypothetical protein
MEIDVELSPCCESVPGSHGKDRENVRNLFSQFGRIADFSDEVPVGSIQPASETHTQDTAISISNQPTPLSPASGREAQKEVIFDSSQPSPCPQVSENVTPQLEEKLELMNKESVLRSLSGVFICGQLSSDDASTGLTVETAVNESMEDKVFKISVLSCALSQGKLFVYM